MTWTWVCRAVVALALLSVVGSSDHVARAAPDVTAVRSPSFVPLTPARVLDTRSGPKVGNASGTAADLELSLYGKGGLPSAKVAAVSLNVTVIDGESPTAGGGYVTVFPCGIRPETSNLNFTAGQTVPNAVIAPVSSRGTICFYVYGSAHLLADVAGYFPTGSDFTSLVPARVLDTRGGPKVGNAVGSGAPRALSVLGKGGVPTSGVGAIAINVTVTDGENPTIGGGYVSVFPCGAATDASSLNFVAGTTVPNLVIAPVSATGTICFFVYGTAHLLADVAGYMPSGSSYVPLTPARLVNTRTGSKVGNASGTGAVLEVSVVGHAGLPGAGFVLDETTQAGSPLAGQPSGELVIGAVALNVTVTEGENPTIGGGYVTVFPCGTRPEASNLNFEAGQTLANAVIAPVSPSGRICFYVYGTAHLLVDVSGFFSTANTIRVKVVDPTGQVLPNTGVMVCQKTPTPCSSPTVPGPALDGYIRIGLTPDIVYDMTGFVSGTGWPCPWVSPSGDGFHFAPGLEDLGAAFPDPFIMVLHKPLPSEC